MTDGERLKKWLRANRMTGKELAKRLGYSKDTVYIITGNRRQMSNSFRWRFMQTFGQAALDDISGPTEKVAS